MSGADANIPESVQELIEDFHAVPDADRLQLLLEFSRSLPDLPERYGEHPEQLEQVRPGFLFLRREFLSGVPAEQFFGGPQAEFEGVPGVFRFRLGGEQARAVRDAEDRINEGQARRPEVVRQSGRVNPRKGGERLEQRGREVRQGSAEEEAGGLGSFFE